ncbi:ABC transporter substrate-binding protein [Truepera radiovictrix]|uniref:Extracellular solute-binding protein family 1 n=1 Tax=Truepera radiovictrix (strain DSM 17093 / CIP 108686 / LMG 22925 / RQ-24) TaxID=649638 RepID=D7CQ63_TRURR|nr:sugar ABC transporter substrate-binding protein [Truepera radiovictrix]ADI14847.1 extracellular solute-binding protein family 1 [Truepera radiovictrix DSM 17093]WMT56602.1 sugar ABC transporter substrate-binding protein [Truepera radiovictrix]
MKRTLATATLLAGTLLGAASAQDAPSGAITVTAWDIAAEALEALVPGFNEQYPDVQVTVENLGNQQVFDRGLAGCAAGGADLPDVYAVENNEAEVFWNRFPDCFLDLTALGADELRDDFPDFKWTELTVGERVYAIPWDSGPVVTFYRRDLYEEAGINPDEIETWDDFIEAGQALDEATGAKMLWFDFSDDGVWRQLANQNGCFYFDPEGTEVTVNQPGCVDAMETMKALYDAGIVAIVDWNGAIQEIRNGTLAGAVFGAWYVGTIQSNAPDQEGNWGVYEMPASEPGGVRAANLGGSALAIPASSQNPEAAMAFIRYALATTEGQVSMLRNQGLVPSYLPALEDPYVQEPVPYWGDQPIWQDILATLGEIPQARGTQYFQEARQIVTNTLSQYLTQNAYEDAQAAMDDAAQQISAAVGLPIAGQ